MKNLEVVAMATSFLFSMTEDLKQRIDLKNNLTYIISTLVETTDKALSVMTKEQFDNFKQYLTNLYQNVQEMDKKFNNI